MAALQPLSDDSFSYSWIVNVKPSSHEALDGSVRLSFDAADGDPFIEIDPWLASLRRASLDAGVHEFDFGVSGTQSPIFAHAEEIFSNGLILPLPLTHPPKRRQQQQQQQQQDEEEEEEPRCSEADLSRSLLLLSLSNRHKSPHMYTVPGRPISLNSPSPLRFRSAQGRSFPLDPSAKRALSRRPRGPKLPFLRTCGRTSKRLLQKYLCFFMPLYKKVKGMKLVWRAEGSSVIVPSVPRSCAVSLDASPRISIDALPVVNCRWLTTALDTGMEKSIHDAVLHCKKSIGDQSRQLVRFTSDEQQISDVSK